MNNSKDIFTVLNSLEKHLCLLREWGMDHYRLSLRDGAETLVALFEDKDLMEVVKSIYGIKIRQYIEEKYSC